MKMTIGHLHRALRASDTIVGELEAANTPAFIENLQRIIGSPHKLLKLMGAVDALRNTTRALEDCVLTGEE